MPPLTTANNERFRLVRELRGWTQEELADRLSVDKSFVANVEAARRPASDRFLEGLALQAAFPVSYFHRDTPPEFPFGSLLFRAGSAAGVRVRNRGRRWAQMTFEIVDSMLRKVTPPSIRLPRLSQEPVEKAAQITRSALGLSPDTPIRHLMRAIERAGVLILLLPSDIVSIDGFSVWAGTDVQRPVIVLARDRAPDRMRMTLAHELAHLVRHQSVSATVATLERDAGQFAAELLFPASRVPEAIELPVTLATLSELKPKWGVSLQLMIRRAHECHVISPRQYRYLFEQIAARGWRHREPDSAAVSPESPRAFRELAELLYGQPIRFQKMADDMDVRVSQIQELLDGYAGYNGSPKKTKVATVRRSGDVLELSAVRKVR